MKYSKARELAETWVRLNCSVPAKILDQNTLAKPYGWVFFYDAVEPGEFLAGNAPILVDRINGELRVFGTAESIEYYLSDYERTLPKQVLDLKPEVPN